VSIKTEDYEIAYDPDLQQIQMTGILRLNGMSEYQPIMDMLLEALSQSNALTLDLTKLEFLNSSGISMLSMFVVKVRTNGTIELRVQGSKQVFWQTKSLKNLQRLMPSLILEIS
jgi:hypothetical protein